MTIVVLLFPGAMNNVPSIASRHGIESREACEAIGRAEVEAVQLIYPKASARFACVQIKTAAT